jgi:hypothetical protein
MLADKPGDITMPGVLVQSGNPARAMAIFRVLSPFGGGQSRTGNARPYGHGLEWAHRNRPEVMMEALLNHIGFALFVAALLLAIVAVPAMRFDNGFSEPRRRRARRAGPSPFLADI